VTLVAVALLIMPQPIGQVVPSISVSVQVTPLFAGSFCTVALKVIVPLFVSAVVTLFVIVTEIGGPLMVNPSESDFVESFTEVAVIVGALVGGTGRPLGGVYVTLVAVAPLNVPHTRDSHAEPFTFNVHVTPELVASFDTVAFSVMAAAPAAMVVILLVMVTEMGVVPMLETVPQPVANSVPPRAVTNKYTRTVQAKLHGLIRMARPLRRIWGF
jgi:hypothetical protein